MINTIIGKYKITRLMGEGGMATVYEAVHEVLGNRVAIKILNPILSANSQIRERFKNEAILMASLNHPNITKVMDFDEQPNHLSFIMEYLEGEDLSDKIKREGALSETEIKHIFSQTLSAFNYAHEKGIVHRDIKPSNIFVLPDGQVKILDFGIAKLFGQGNEMTQTGTQMGTPLYMSPEQVKADKSIDHRSDIYSLGVTLYFAANGKAPYDSGNDSQFNIFNKIVFEALPDLNGNAGLNEIIKKACQKNREDRFQTCKEWLDVMNSNSMSQKESNLVEEKTKISKDAKVVFANELGSGEKKEVQVSVETNPIQNKKDSRLVIKIILSVLALFILKIIFSSISNSSSSETWEREENAITDSAASTISTDSDRMVDSIRAADSAAKSHEWE